MTAPFLVILEENVLDIAPFIDQHPGGPAVFDAFRQGNMSPIKNRRPRRSDACGNDLEDSKDEDDDDDDLPDLTRLFRLMGHSEGARARAQALMIRPRRRTHVEIPTMPPGPQSEPSTPFVGTSPNQQPHEVEADGSLVASWLSAAEAWDAELDAKLTKQSASHTVRGYGARWHDSRRVMLHDAHGPAMEALRAKCRFFSWSAVIGLCSSLLHYWMVTTVVPHAATSIFCPVSASESRVRHPGWWEWAIRTFAAVDVEAGASSAWNWGFFICFVWWAAFVIGAQCRMISFAVAHEVVHENVHPLLMTTGESHTLPNSGKSRLQVATVALRMLAKDLLLRAVTLPSVGIVHYEYYKNAHLSHHRYLGALDASDSSIAVANGSQRADGDQLSVANLLMKQRMSSVRLADSSGVRSVADYDSSITIHNADRISTTSAARESTGSNARAAPDKVPVFRFDRQSLESLNALSIIRASKFSHTAVARFLLKRPLVAKLVIDPPFHIAHFCLQVGMSALYVLAILPVVAAGAVALLPHRAYQLLLRWQRRLVERGTIGQPLVPGEKAVLWRALQRAWPIVAVGIQGAASWLLLWIMASSVWARGGQRGGPLCSATSLAGSGLYAVLAELFVFGFAFHPFLAYFLTVHNSANVSRSEPCQPTRSIYCWWLSLATMNLTHHVEHHDCPWIACAYLPRLTAIAPRMYHSPTIVENVSPWRVIMEYLRDNDTYVYACSGCS